jgi:hypothetical protein
MDETGVRADASIMFKEGDNPETPALRPSRCLRVGVAGNWRASRTPSLPGVWQKCGNGSDYSPVKLEVK